MAAEEAVAETAQVARGGLPRGVHPRELDVQPAHLVRSHLPGARGITYLLRVRRTVGPFRPLRVGRRHIHHFVPGIVIAFCAGAGAILTRDEDLEPWLAVPFGVGMGLTLDESALLLELEDVYWSREGLLSVQITLAVMAMLGALALGLRFLRRGEQIVLEMPSEGGAAPSEGGAALPRAAQASGPDDLIRPMEADLPRPTAPATTSQVGRRPLRGGRRPLTRTRRPPAGVAGARAERSAAGAVRPGRAASARRSRGSAPYGGRCLRAAGSRSLAHRAWASKPLASWGSRVGAALIDWVVLFIPAVILFFVVVAGAVGISGDDDASTGAAIAAFILFAILISLVWLLYAPLLMMREGEHNGQTWGSSWSASAWCVTTASG